MLREQRMQLSKVFELKTKHEIKTCPRCGRLFECKLNNPLHCQCAGVTLSERQLNYIQEIYEDCLCVHCLNALKEMDIGIKGNGEPVY